MVDRTLAVPARLDSVREVGQWLNAASEAGRLPYEVAFALDLALHEAVENVIRHGLRQHEGHSVSVRFRSDGERVEIEVEDDGPPFDPLSIAPPRQAERLEDVIPGGHGLQLMRHFSDELRYRRERDRNILTLVRGLSARRGRA